MTEQEQKALKKLIGDVVGICIQNGSLASNPERPDHRQAMQIARDRVYSMRLQPTKLTSVDSRQAWETWIERTAALFMALSPMHQEPFTPQLRTAKRKEHAFNKWADRTNYLLTSIGTAKTSIGRAWYRLCYKTKLWAAHTTVNERSIKINAKVTSAERGYVEVITQRIHKQQLYEQWKSATTNLLDRFSDFDKDDLEKDAIPAIENFMVSFLSKH